MVCQGISHEAGVKPAVYRVFLRRWETEAVAVSTVGYGNTVKGVQA
jgi:hypothetical protein